MDALVKTSVWAIILVFIAGQFNSFLQTTMLDAGIISKKIQLKDAACEYEIVPQWVKDVLECKKEVKKEVQNKLSQKRSIKLDLDGDLLEKFRFDEREKTTFELFTIYINKLLAYLQSLILPKNLVMPCIVGNCDMDKKIKKERELYENLLAKKYGLNPPEKKHEKHEEKRIPDEKNVKG